MKYSFKIFKSGVGTVWYYAELEDEKYYILNNFTDAYWTTTKVQEIINGIEASKEKPKREEYIWANEDVTLYSNKNGVLLIDMMSQRGGETDPEKLGLMLTHKELITFLEDFKEFVAKNS